MRLVLAVYWSDDEDADTSGRPSPIKGSGAVVTMTPAQVERNVQEGLRATLDELDLADAIDWWEVQQ